MILLKLKIWEPGAAPGPTEPKSVVQKCCYTIPSELYAKLKDSTSSHFIVQAYLAMLYGIASIGLKLHERDFTMLRRYKLVMKEDKIQDADKLLFKVKSLRNARNLIVILLCSLSCVFRMPYS